LVEVKIRAHFYAQLRDAANASYLDVDLPEHSNISALLEIIYELKPALRRLDKSILVGAGVEFVDRNYKIKTGDEIAIMPPVQGG
jgi:molybdopterin converting factor small subunit